MFPAVIDPDSPEFPPTSLALEEPNGLLAVGGNLSVPTLLDAYKRGIFPWFSEGEPILWWSPDPRMSLVPSEAHFGRSLIKLAKKQPFQVTTDQAFLSVIQHCAEVPREGQNGTWITDDMLQAYFRLHEAGYAHSIEAWSEGQLIGGLYGIAIGRAFFGESMFSLKSGASKIAFASLCVQLQQWGFELIDCQVYTDYLASFGAVEMDRREFEERLARATALSSLANWSESWSLGAFGFDGFK